MGISSIKQYGCILILLGLFSVLLNCGSDDETSGTPPAIPQGFTATALSMRITLTWTEEEGITYTLFRSTAPNFVTSDETKISDNAVSPYDDEGLTINTTYYYRLMAVNPSGASEPTSEISAALLLETPQVFTARAFNRRVTLTWTEEEGVAYALFRSTTQNFMIGNETKLSDNAASPYDDLNLTNGETYYYRLKAVNFVGASKSTDETSATPLLRAPKNFTARAFNQRVTLTWTVEEAIEGDVPVTYTLFRSTVPEFDVNDTSSRMVRRFSNITTSLRHDRRLTNDTTYYYRLTANSVSAANEPIASEPTEEVSATPQLRSPQNFTARAFNQRVTLTWTVEEAVKGGTRTSTTFRHGQEYTRVTYIPDAPVTYTLFASTDSNFMIGNETEITDNITSPYNVENLTNGTTYYYRLTANSVSAANEPIASAPTGEVSATPTLVPKGFTARAFNRRVTLTWTGDEGVTYTLFRSTDSNFMTGSETQISDTATSPYNDINLTNGEPYYYRLTASFFGDTSEPTDAVSATPLLRIPQNFTAQAFSRQVTLSWDKEEGVTYNLFYATTAGFALESGTKISGVTPPHTVAMLTNNTPYYFRLTANIVSATNEPIASEPTNDISATPQTQISAGDRHTCSVVEVGVVPASRAFCWGRNDRGQLGNGKNTDNAAPQEVAFRASGITGDVAQISVGDHHTCAVVEVPENLTIESGHDGSTTPNVA